MSNGANHLGGVLASGRGTPIRVDSDGEEYSTHLYVAEDTGVAKIKFYVIDILELRDVHQ